MANRNIHHVYHEFLATFKRPNGDTWRFSGADLINRVEAWAKKHPKDAWVTTCDDNVFCSSILVLIESKTKGQYMGCSVVFISQHGAPAEFFLYPNNQRRLADILNMLAPLRDKSIE